MEHSRLTSSEFVAELFNKTRCYYVAADLFRGADGKRFDKNILSDPLFYAIQYLRERAINEGLLQEFLSDSEEEFRRKFQGILAKQDRSYSRLLSQTYLRAARSGDLMTLSRLYKLSELYEKRLVRSRPTAEKSDSVSWHYFAGLGALRFLVRDSVPTKKEVKKFALFARARYELPVESYNKEFKAKLGELQRRMPKNWARIFRDLGLSSLPSAPTR